MQMSRPKVRCVGPGQQIRGGLGRGVGGVGLQRVVLGPGALRDRPVHLVGGDVHERARRRRSTAACSSFWVPRTLVRTNVGGPVIDRSTCDSAAKCTITSCPGTRSATRSASQMSPLTNGSAVMSATGARFARVAGVGQLVQHGDLCPGRLRIRPGQQPRTKFEPMNPAAPVISSLTRSPYWAGSRVGSEAPPLVVSR